MPGAEALVLLVAPLVAGDCGSREQFMFKVEEVRQKPLRGLELVVEVSTPDGPVRSTDTVRDGAIRVCVAGGRTGQAARVTPSDRSPGYQVLYPPASASQLVKESAPTIVVCRTDLDCPFLTREEARKLIERTKPLVVQASLSPQERKAFFAEWKRYLESQGMKSGVLVEELHRKERKVVASMAASELLSRFTNRAREIVDRFRRYGPEAIDHPSSGPFTQINNAIRDYNPVYDDLNEKVAAYRQETAELWGAARSTEYQYLVDEALRIHGRIYELNELGMLITDCRHRIQKTCPDKSAAQTRVIDGAGRVAGEVEAELDAFALRQRKFTDRLTDDLFE